MKDPNYNSLFEEAFKNMINLRILHLDKIEEQNYKFVVELSNFIPLMTALRHLTLQYYYNPGASILELGKKYCELLP